MLLGTTPVSPPNGISFCPSVLTGYRNVTDRQTDRWTEHVQTRTSVAIGGIADAFSDAIARVHPIHLLNAEQRRAVTDRWTKPVVLSREAALTMTILLPLIPRKWPSRF